jgi:hypothetical protein
MRKARRTACWCGWSRRGNPLSISRVDEDQRIFRPNRKSTIPKVADFLDTFMRQNKEAESMTFQEESLVAEV